MPTSDDRPRVGHIQFLNCLPLYWGLERNDALDQMVLVSDTPDRLSDALVAGDLDVGPISLVEALRHADDLVLLPEAAVTSDGPVQSVCIVSTRPLSDLANARIALGSTSRTSIELAKLVLESRLSVTGLSYVTEPPDVDRMLQIADAAVLIGDPALRATLVDGPARGWTVTDLGAEWRAWTGMPMVFAVWCARREFADARPEVVAPLRQAFADALTTARRSPAEVADNASQADPAFTPTQLASYYAHLGFELGTRERGGMQEFERRLGSSGAAGRLIRSIPEFRKVD